MIVPAGMAFSNVMAASFVVAILYFAREILVPIALAILLSFVLAPLVRLLQRLKLPRTLAVIGAVGAAFIITFSLATMVMVEVNQLADDLPRYETTLGNKIRNLRDAVGRVGVLKNASNLLKDLDRQLSVRDQEEPSPPPSGLPADGKAKTPIPVEVHQPDPAASETLVAMLRPLLTPFTTTGIVVLFLIFFLFQREDLRNRFIRLAYLGLQCGTPSERQQLAGITWSRLRCPGRGGASANPFVERVLRGLAQFRQRSRLASSARTWGAGVSFRPGQRCSAFAPRAPDLERR